MITNMSLQIGKSFTIPLDAVTQTFAILAKRGVGKTYTANVMAEEMLENTQQIAQRYHHIGQQRRGRYNSTSEILSTI